MMSSASKVGRRWIPRAAAARVSLPAARSSPFTSPSALSPSPVPLAQLSSRWSSRTDGRAVRRLSTAATPSPQQAASDGPSPFHYDQLLSPLVSTTPVSVLMPTYDRSHMHKGILHFGVGGFHRAHLAFYMDALLHLHGVEAECQKWGICGVGVRESDRRISDAMKAQNGYYCLVVRGTKPEHTEVRILGSMLDYLFSPDEPARVLRQLMSPHTRIVSLTITETGYDLAHNPEVQEDIQHFAQHQRHLTADAHDASAAGAPWPRSVFGWILLGIDGRRRAGLEPFVVLSCDNLLHNGQVTKDSLMSSARAAGDAELCEYIASSVSCPSSMVDRITPVTQPQDVEYCEKTFGIKDRWPIMTEQWTQWVIEEKDSHSFPYGKPPFHLLNGERYNVLVVSDVTPYEAMKLRLLNATHSAICYLGYMCGYSYIHEIMADPDFVKHAQNFMDREVTSTLPPVPNIDLDEYKRKIVERFANPNIRDTTLRVCMDGSSKWPKFLLPTLRAQLSAHPQSAAAVHHSALIIAAWFRFLNGQNDEGQAIPISDGLAVQLGLTELASSTRSDARALFHAARPIFGELSDNEVLVAHVQKALDMLYELRAKEAMKQWAQLGEVHT